MTTDALDIRAASPLDVHAIAALWRAENMTRSDAHAAAECAAVLDRYPELLLVAELEGVVVGAVAGSFIGHRGWLNHLVVAPAHRGRGIAGRLVDEIERRFAAAGVEKVNILVLVENDAGRAFWAQRGFMEVPQVLFAHRWIEPPDAPPAPCD